MTRCPRKQSLPSSYSGAICALILVATMNPTSSEADTLNPCSITANFNGTAMPGSDYVWFNSVLKVQGLDTSNGPVTITFQGSTIQFVASGTPYMLVAPSARITFDPAATSATTVFTGGQWVT